MATDNDNWQEKPGEGESSAGRDGENNSGNRGINPRPWHKKNEGGGYRDGNFDRPRRPYSGNTHSGNTFDKPRRSYGSDNERPRRAYNEDGNRFGNSFERPRRNFEESGNRFEGSGRERGQFDRPRRNFDDNSSDRPRRSYGGSGNRFEQSGNRGFDRPRRNFGDTGRDRPRRDFGDNGNRFGGSEADGNRFERPRRNTDEYSNERPRRPYREREFGGQSRPNFGGPTLPRPARADGRPRRPRIMREKPFDHGVPFGGSTGFQPNLDPNVPIRLNKYLANAGICSRREADEFIQAGVVKVNGEVVTELGVKVKPSDTIMFHDQTVNVERKVYILLNKPKDCVTTSDDPQERRTVMDLVKDACYERIYPVGRLDRNTTGVLLLTNDGDLASKLTHPKYEKRKIYQATLDRDLTESDFNTIMAGITLDDEIIHTDNLSFVKPDTKSVIGIEIHSGQNRVVRRIFESLGYKVYKLDRVYFAGLTKKNLPRGRWRYLTEKEVGLLKMGAFV